MNRNLYAKLLLDQQTGLKSWWLSLNWSIEISQPFYWYR